MLFYPPASDPLSSMEYDLTEAKTCLRCGQSIRRKVMATAKYCSAECRQRCAKEAYEKREKRERGLHVADPRLHHGGVGGHLAGQHAGMQVRTILAQAAVGGGR